MPAPLGVADCERVRDGLVGQPANTVSSLAYLAAGGALAARAGRAPVGDRGWLLAYAAATATNGLGGVAYHGPGGAASRWLHDAALLATLGLITVADIRDLGGTSRWHVGALAVAAGGALLALSPTASTRAQVALGAGAVAAEGAAHLARSRGARPAEHAEPAGHADHPGHPCPACHPGPAGPTRHAGHPGRAGTRQRLATQLIIGGVAATVYAMSRSGRPLCRPDSLLQGHAAWHGLTALMLWWRGRAAAAAA